MHYRHPAISTARMVLVIVIVALISFAGAYAVLGGPSTRPTAITSGTTVTTGATVISGTTFTTVTTLTGPTSISRGGTLLVEEPQPPDSLDPGTQNTSGGGEIVDQVFQTLLGMKSNSSEIIIPVLAESYTVTSDGLTYNFVLRQGITFSNGDAFNAYVAWFSIYRAWIMQQSLAFLIGTPLNMTGVTAAQLNEFTGAGSSNVPPSSLLQVMQNNNLAITVTGPYSLQFHLAAPFSSFLAILTQPPTMIVDPNVVSQHGGIQAGQPNTWMNTNPIGTGPFVVTQYTPSAQTVLQVNPNYWGGPGYNYQPTPRLDKVIVKYVPSTLTRLEDLQAGTAQYALIDFSIIGQTAGSAGIYLPPFTPVPLVGFVGLDTQKFPFNNTLIRLAVMHAINYSQIYQQFHGLINPWVGPSPCGFFPGSEDPCTHLQPYSYNLTLAKQLLAQAGHPNGNGIPAVTFAAQTDQAPYPEVAIVVQADLAQIGINVKIQQTTIAQLFSSEGTDPKAASYPDFSGTLWMFFRDPWAYAPWFTSSKLALGLGGNPAWFINSTVDSLLAQAATATNPATEAQLYTQVGQLVYQQAPYLWFGQVRGALAEGIPVLGISIRGFQVPQNFWLADFSTLYFTS